MCQAMERTERYYLSKLDDGRLPVDPEFSPERLGKLGDAFEDSGRRLAGRGDRNPAL